MTRGVGWSMTLWLAVLLVALGMGGAPETRAAQTTDRITGIAVTGNQRIEPETVVSYMVVRPGDPFDPKRLDRSLKRLIATGLFSDVYFTRTADGTLVVHVTENPIINRILFEGNRRMKDDKLREEVQLKPRIVFTRAKVRADVQRILDLYRRSGRFAAVVEPKIVQLPQNRVDLIFEISEGPKSKIRQINFIGNRRFSDSDLRDELATKQARWWKIFTSNDTYDPDRQAFDREQLRRFYFNKGYADFRVVAAVSELTPDRRNFITTYVVEEGEIYHFGKIAIESEIKDIEPEVFKSFLHMREGEIYSLKKITDSVDALTNIAGVLGYAFVNIRPIPKRDRKKRVIDITFKIFNAPRVYVERINIKGNLRTRDYVIRREFRLVEGDAFNLSKVERSKQRIQRLGFFREVEIEQLPGSREDRLVLEANVQEEATGSLSLGAAFSSFENFIFQFELAERNFLGKGQDVRINFAISSIQTNIVLSFTEPYLWGRNISAGFDLFRSNFQITRNANFDTTSTGASLRAGLPLGELSALALRYSIRQDDVNLGLFSSRFLLDSQGSTLTSLVGYSLIYDSLNHPLRPTRGQRAIFSQDFAGVGGDKRFLRTTIDYDGFFPLFWGFIAHLGANGAYIDGLGQRVRISDRFFLGGPELRGFDIAGVGPRAARVEDDSTLTDLNTPLGGRAKYVGTAELIFPLGESARELGVQVSGFFDAGALWKADSSATFEGETIVGNTFKPRMSVGIGVSWQSPFGPFRIDLAFPLKKQPFDDTQKLQFNVGTSF